MPHSHPGIICNSEDEEIAPAEAVGNLTNIMLNDRAAHKIIHPI